MKVKKIGPCRVLKKLGENAYEIEFPGDIGISLTFNVSDLYPYKAEEAGAGMMNNQKSSGRSRCRLQKIHRWSVYLTRE